MIFTDKAQLNFVTEISEFVLSQNGIFNCDLVNALEHNFGLKGVMIFCFDADSNFLSWIDDRKVSVTSPSHPYHDFEKNDVVAHYIFRESIKQSLRYDNLVPYVYRATDLMPGDSYEHSYFTKFLQDHFHMKYNLTMSFGTNGFLQLRFYKTEEEGDFSDEEVELYKIIYRYIAQTYRTFKIVERGQIIADIQNGLISEKWSAYLIADFEMHIIHYNHLALEYMSDYLGEDILEFDQYHSYRWIPHILDGRNDGDHRKKRVRESAKYIFESCTVEKKYPHGVVECYYCILISPKNDEEKKQQRDIMDTYNLTNVEKQVAVLLCQGLTYQGIAEQLFISYHTVKNHVQNIFEKCNVNSRYLLYLKLMK